MGKFDNQRSDIKSRLSNMHADEEEDARTKIQNKRDSAPLDARELLKRRQEEKSRLQKTSVSLISPNKASLGHSSATMLLNTFKKIINTDPTSNENSAVANARKRVISNIRDNTLITVKNTQPAAATTYTQGSILKRITNTKPDLSFKVVNEPLPAVNRVISNQDVDMEAEQESAESTESTEYRDYIKSLELRRRKSVDAEEPVQGYQLRVTNLHKSVSEADLLELFSSVGAIKRARYAAPSIADIVYVRLEDARAALERLDGAEIDGRHIKIEMVTKIPISLKLQTSARAPLGSKIASDELLAMDTCSARERLETVSSKMSFARQGETVERRAAIGSSKVTIDPSIIKETLLYKSAANRDTNSKPVTFTVKL